MNVKNNFSNIIILILGFTFIFMGTAYEKENSINSAYNSFLLKSSDMLSEPYAGNNAITNLVDYTERQIVADICNELYGFNEKDSFDHADYIMNIAEALPERSLGNIVSKEDAIQKARSVLIETEGAEYVERMESNFVELNEEKINYQRNNSTYDVTSYDEYDLWLININLPSGITKDGKSIITPGMTPYVMMRGSDGKVIAVFH